MKSKLKIFTINSGQGVIKNVMDKNLLPIIVMNEITLLDLKKYEGTTIHFKELAPSIELENSLDLGAISSEDFLKKYIIELSEVNFKQLIRKLENLSELSNSSGIALIGNHGLLALSDLFNNFLENPAESL